jgi:hypothetical protein
MARSPLSGPSERVQIAFVVGYLLLVVYAATTGNPLAALAADVLFAVAAVVIGATLIQRRRDETPALAAGAAFILAGLAEAVSLALGLPAAGAVSGFLVLVGVAMYIVSQRR